MNKKTIITLALATVIGAGTCFARPGNGGGHRPAPAPRHHAGGHRPPPPPRHHGGHRGGSVWGRGGRNFLPGFIGGLVGSTVANTIVRSDPVVVTPAPVVVTPAPVTTTMVVTPQRVWVEGRYIDQIQPNGTIIRVWQPGHYVQM